MKSLIRTLLTLLISSCVGIQAFALSYDFNVGIGIQPPMLALEKGKDWKIRTFSWKPIGGFIGAGISFGETFVSSLGLEYSGYWQIYSKESFIEPSNPFHATFHSFYQFADLYYKVGVLKESLPVDVQVNLGLAVQNLLTLSYNQDGGIVSDDINAVGLGLHSGLRVSVHMLFIGVDYNFLPFYSIDQSRLNANELGFHEHIFGVTVGIIFNKGILDSFLAN